MRVEPKAMVKRLTPSATTTLEQAVGRAATSGHYEITVEHFLAQLLRRAPGHDTESEAAMVVRAAGQDPERLLASVERVLETQKAGNTGRPAFSDHLFQWLEDAWLWASVERGESRLRSGVLLLQLIRRKGRYTREDYRELEALTLDTALTEANDVLSALHEEVEASADGTPADSQGRAAGGDGALGRFSTNLTESAKAGKIDPIFGRHREIRQLVDILCRRRKNNPILVGEPGVGKTALVEGLALAVAEGDVPASLKDVEICALDLGALQAGASVRGEFENRLRAVLDEVKGADKPTVLFIDEAHTLIGAGGPQGGGDAANLLKPALARGEIRTIAATTWAEYKKYFEKDAALERRFQPVKVEEPSEDDAIVMLRGLARVYERAHGVLIRDEAVEAAAKLSKRYLAGRQLPDKAVDLLDTTCARLRVSRETKPERLVALERKKQALERSTAALTRDLVDGAFHLREPLAQVEEELQQVRGAAEELEQRWHEQRGVLEELLSQRDALWKEREGHGGTPADRQNSDGQDMLRAPVDAEADKRFHALKARFDALSGDDPLVHLDVDADAVARTLSSWTGIPLGTMKRDTRDTVLDLEARIQARVIGQDAAAAAIGRSLRIAHADIRDPDRPVGVFLFVGPSGVGKTETSLALADLLYGGDRFLVPINMSEFQEKHSLSRLVGSPPGYVGYGEGGVLTEAVRQRPYSVVLLDECEKADLDVMNLFYQVFDKGVLSDGEGRQIDFRNTLLVLTSNLASETMTQVCLEQPDITADELAELIRPELSRHFKPALLARMTIVPFVPLRDASLKQIAALKLGKITRRLAEVHGLETQVDQSVLDELARRCTTVETGARNLDHILRATLMPELARKLIEEMTDDKETSHGGPSTLQLRYEDGFHIQLG